MNKMLVKAIPAELSVYQGLLTRLLYRHANAHRRTDYFTKAKQLQRVITRIVDLNLPNTIETFAKCWVSVSDAASAAAMVAVVVVVVVVGGVVADL